MSLQPPQGLPFIPRLYSPNLVTGSSVLLWTRCSQDASSGAEFQFEIAYPEPDSLRPPCHRHPIASTMPELVPNAAYVGIVETMFEARPHASRSPRIDVQYVSVADLRRVPVYQLICPRIPNTVVYVWTDDWIISRKQIPTIPITKVYRYGTRIIETIEFYDQYGMFCQTTRREFEPDMVKRSPKALADLPELTEGQFKTLDIPFVTPNNLVFRNKRPPA